MRLHARFVDRRRWKPVQNGAGWRSGSFFCANARAAISDSWRTRAPITLAFIPTRTIAEKAPNPLVDYEFELAHPERTIRQYEWQGIYRVIGSLVPLSPATQWLDFGCGNAGLVRFCRSKQLSAVGFEEGAIADKARAAGIPIMSRANLADQCFDVITAIEVLEHVEDPIAVLRDIRRLLKPGGLFFLTTGNAGPYRGRLSAWSYVTPEIHISFFEPETMRQALTMAGFRAEFRGYMPGFTEIIRFKILKNLRVRTQSAWERALPWALLAKIADARFGVSAHPVAWAANNLE